MSTETDLLELEDELWRANREGDGGFYDRVLRDDAMLVSKWGVLDKAAVVPGISRNHNPYTKTEISDRKVLRISADSALVTYRVAVTNAEDFTFEALATTVYAREGDGWRGVFHQQSLL